MTGGKHGHPHEFSTGRLGMKKILVALLVGCATFFPAMAEALDVGTPAPLFEAMSDKGPVSLQDFRGQKNVVLAFYFADFSPV
jgi:hypothetical protein